MERTLDHDVANVAKHFGGDEGDESSMMAVQIMSITGDVFAVDISSDSTVAELEKKARLAMKADRRVLLSFEGNPVPKGALSESGVKDGSVLEAVVVITEALTDANLRPALKMWFDPSTRQEAIDKYGEIGDWDVISVTDMSQLFEDMRDFNENISQWDTG